MRPMFYEFPADETCAELKDQYLYGSRYLVAPVLEPGATTRRVYLPQGAQGRALAGGELLDGRQWITVPTPIEHMPAFERIG